MMFSLDCSIYSYMPFCIRRWMLSSLFIIFAVAVGGCSEDQSGDASVEQREQQATEPFVAEVMNEQGTDYLEDDVLQEDLADVHMEIDQADTPHETYTGIDLRVAGDTVRQLSSGDIPFTHDFEDVDLSEFDAVATRTPIDVVVHFDSGETLTSRDTVAVDTRGPAVSALQSESEIEPTIYWNLGVPQMVDMEIPASGSTNVQKALNFLSQYPDLYRISDPTDSLVPEEVTETEDGMTTVMFRQHMRGLPVSRSYLTVVMQDGNVISTLGRYYDDRTLNLVSEQVDEFLESNGIAPWDAEQTAREAFSEEMDVSESWVVGKTRGLVFPLVSLSWSDFKLSSVQADEFIRVVWRVSLQAIENDTQMPLQTTVYVDSTVDEVIAMSDEYPTSVQHQGYFESEIDNAQGTGSGLACYQANAKDAVCEGHSGDASQDCPNAVSDAQNAFEFMDTHDGFIYDALGVDGLMAPLRIYPAVVNTTKPKSSTAMYARPCNEMWFKSDIDQNHIGADTVWHESTHMLVAGAGGFFHGVHVFGKKFKKWTPKLSFQKKAKHRRLEPVALNEHYAQTYEELVGVWSAGNGSSAYNIYDIEPNHRNDLSSFSDPHDKAALFDQVIGHLVEGGTLNGYNFGSPHLTVREAAELMYDARDWNFIGKSASFSDYARGVTRMAKYFVRHSPKWGYDWYCRIRNGFAVAGYRTHLLDSDCDGTPDNIKSPSCANYKGTKGDMDGDNIKNPCDPDIDGDGVLNKNEDPGCERMLPIEDDETQTVDLPSTSSHRDREWDCETGDVGCGDGKADACSDPDGDGVRSDKDDCPYSLPAAGNSSHVDTDGDGYSDACDVDDDGDGVDDVSDNCIDTPNPGQADADWDGTGDLCDDRDGDGIVDVNDNCPDISNHDQKDPDNDGQGNPCDSDDDDDEIQDSDDLCPRLHKSKVPDGEHSDGDGDKVGDQCDNCPEDSNPSQADNDARNDTGNPRDSNSGGDKCDNDDDNDGVIDSNDNCSKIANPNQDEKKCSYDDYARMKRNGVTAQHIGMGSSLNNFPTDPLRINKIPAGVCEETFCEPGQPFPDGVERKISISARHKFVAVLTNGDGEVMFSSEAVYDETSGAYEAEVTWKPEKGSNWPSSSSPTEHVYTESYYIRAIGKAEGGTERHEEEYQLTHSLQEGQ